MSIDLSQQTGALRRRADVCVIGAGAAGITTARRLLAAGHQVLLLESGGLDYERETADLNAGKNVGQAYYDLDDARLRFFGGTTAIWGGRCATLDPIDLQRRDWVAGSGWPLSWDELQDYYGQARGIFEIGDEPASAEALSAHGVPLPGFDRSELHMPVWNFDPRFNRFTFDACQDLRDHPRCEIITHASVTRIVTKDGAISRIEAKALAGAHLHVEARAFVLAAGGIENARLLLASNIGNERDQVGRNFMEHPHARGGRIVDAKAWPLLKAFGRRHRIGGHDMAALITPSADLQRREGLLNSSLTIVGRQPARASQFWGMRAYGSLKHDMSPTRSGRRMWMMTKKAATWAQRHVDPLRPWLLHKAGKLEIALLVRAEQAPNPDSRVLLTKERDALGVPRVALDWRLSAI
ncbi:MAG: FAD-dependent oxidoreductase, partial [Sphingobium yanoikuyae]